MCGPAGPQPLRGRLPRGFGADAAAFCLRLSIVPGSQGYPSAPCGLDFPGPRSAPQGRKEWLYEVAYCKACVIVAAVGGSSPPLPRRLAAARPGLPLAGPAFFRSGQAGVKFPLDKGEHLRYYELAGHIRARRTRSTAQAVSMCGREPQRFGAGVLFLAPAARCVWCFSQLSPAPPNPAAVAPQRIFRQLSIRKMSTAFPTANSRRRSGGRLRSF